MFQAVLTTLQAQGYPVQIGFFSVPQETRDLEAYFPAEYYPKKDTQTPLSAEPPPMPCNTRVTCLAESCQEVI